jgi:hypothetical protein
MPPAHPVPFITEGKSHVAGGHLPIERRGHQRSSHGVAMATTTALRLPDPPAGRPLSVAPSRAMLRGRHASGGRPPCCPMAPIEPRGARAARGLPPCLRQSVCFCFRSLPEGFRLPRCILPAWTELWRVDGSSSAAPIGVAPGWEGWSSNVPPAALLSRVLLESFVQQSEID